MKKQRKEEGQEKNNLKKLLDIKPKRIKLKDLAQGWFILTNKPGFLHYKPNWNLPTTNIKVYVLEAPPPPQIKTSTPIDVQIKVSDNIIPGDTDVILVKIANINITPLV